MAVASGWATAKRVHNTESSSVVYKFTDVGVFTGTTPLSLATKKTLKGVLANILT